MNLITQKQITAIKNMLNGFNKTELPSYLYKAILNIIKNVLPLKN